MNIILIGFMGSGKTTVAKKLADKLGFQFADADAIIIEKSGRKSDTEIFEKDGEVAFREFEILVSNELKDRQNMVIAAGGGIVMNKINIDYLKKNGVVVYLKSSFDIAKDRVTKHKMRPLFADHEKAQALYELRLPLYAAYADVTVKTDDKTIDAVADDVIKGIEKLK